MPLQIVTEQYNGLNSLYANAGDWVDAESSFTTRFYAISTTSNKFVYHKQGSNFWIERMQGNWTDDGFLEGDIINLSVAVYTASNPNQQQQDWDRTITYIDGNKLYFDAELVYVPGGLGAPPDGATFPTDGIWSLMGIVAEKLPNSLEFYFNLTANGTTSLNSLIDSEVSRFELQDVDSMSVSDVLPMIQLGNKSGGLIKNVQLEYVADSGNGFHDFKVTYKFFQSVVIQDGFEIPSVYEVEGCVAPIINLKAFAQYGNPNGVLQATTQNTEANTGIFDENYNGAPNNYTLQSIVWKNGLGETIEALDNSATSSFTAVINAPNQANPNSTYNIGLMWRPIDAEFYQNRQPSLGNNLLVLAPEVDFIADGSTDATVYSGLPYIGDQSGVTMDGAQWDFQNLKFELTGVDELTVSGDVIPNAAATTMFAQFQDDGRKSTLWLSIANYNLTGFSVDRVSLTLFDEDNYDAPTVGVQIPDVVLSELYDHDGNDITDATDPNTTTEDDVLYRSNFLLIDDVNYEGIKTRLYAYNTVTEESFTLESNFFSFSNVVNIDGQFQPNFVIPRGFNLPPDSDRNHIHLIRKPNEDIAGKYGIQLEYGFLNRWEYWQEQSNVSDDFFNTSNPFNGKNKNWQPFTEGDWELRLSYYTVVDGVDDFNNQTIKIRPYEDDTVTTAVVFTVLSDGTNPTNPPANELVEVEVTLTKGTDWAQEWFEATYEDYEAGNRWVMSSILDQGNINANPLKPISGATAIDVTIVGGVATLKFLLDTNIVNVNESCLSYRAYSFEIDYEYVITEKNDADAAFSLRKLSPEGVYPDSSPCIRVRRPSDDSELDIGFVSNALDTASLLAFCAGTDGYVTTWYDQSGTANHASRPVKADQPRIVSSGVIDVDPNNGLPGIYFQTSDYMVLTTAIPMTQLFYQAHVVNRPTAGTTTIGLASDLSAFSYAYFWWSADQMYSALGTQTLHDSGLTQTGDFLISIFRNNLNDVKININGSALTTKNYAVGVGQLKILGSRNTGDFNNSVMQELIYYAIDKESEVATIEGNINAYYSIY
jgi:hypothetical protein